MSTIKKNTVRKPEKTEKKAVAKAAEPLMYIGPDDPEIGIQNTVYSEIPAGALAVKETVPEVMNLFIPIGEYPIACQQLRDGKGYYFSAFRKVAKRTRR